MSKIDEKGAPVAQISTKSGAGPLYAWAETSQLATTQPKCSPMATEDFAHDGGPRGYGYLMDHWRVGRQIDKIIQP